MLIVSPEITLEDIDEALGYLNERLHIDRYGLRMTHHRREVLTEAIDDLLDERLILQRRLESGL
jgi:hypothetical protein